MSVHTHDAGNGIIVTRKGEQLMLIDRVNNTDIPLRLDQDDDLLVIDALKAARRAWEREEGERMDRERLRAWNMDVLRSYEPKERRR